MTRKKLYVEQAMVDRTIAAREVLIEKIREFSDHLKSEGISLTHEILNKFLQQGYPAIQNILIAEAQKGMKKMKIAGTLISGSVEEQASKIAREFHEYHQWILDAQVKAHISSSQVTIQDGIPVLTDEEKKEIEERFTVYLREEDEDLYAELEEFMKAFEKLSAFLKDRNIDLMEHLEASVTENDLIMVEPGIYEIRNDTLFIGKENAPGIRINPKYFKS